MASSTHIQLAAMLDDLKSAKGGSVSWRVGKVFNALLEKAKEEHADNVALSAIDPLQPGSGNEYVARMSVNDVQTIVGQAVAATNTGPSIG